MLARYSFSLNLIIAEREKNDAANHQARSAENGESSSEFVLIDCVEAAG